MEMRQTRAGREEENGPEGGRTRTRTPAARQQNINDGATRTRRLDIQRRSRGGGADVATCMEWAALGWDGQGLRTFLLVYTQFGL